MMTRKQFGGFMAAPQGRGLRVGAGLALMGWGLSHRQPAVLALGTVSLLAGVLDVCLLAPLLKLPFRGDDLRRRT